MSNADLTAEGEEEGSGHPGSTAPTNSPLRRVLPLLVLVVAAFTIAVVVNRMVFPFFTGDDDDTVYVFEAKTLSAGHLTLSAAEQGEFFRPWLTGIHDGRIVFPFQSGWPAVLAASELAFGSTVVALGLTAAALVLVGWLLAKEILRDRVKASVAAAFLLGSPFFLVHSGTYLNYLFTVLLEASFAFFVLRGLRCQSRLYLVGAGLALGAAFLTRPYDSILIAVPLGLYTVLTQRRDVRRLGASLGWLGAGFVGPFAVALALNAHLSGNVLTFPESVNGGIQRFGFGPRRLAQGTHLVNYTAGTAIHTLARNLTALPKWFFGSFVAVGLAVWGAIRPRLGAYRVVLVGIALVFPIGYVFWWGSFLSVAARDSIGPHYYLPVMLPVAILAADVLIDVYRRRAAVANGVLVAMAALTVAVLPSIHSATTVLPDAFRHDHGVVTKAHLTNALLFLPRAADEEPYVLHPFPYLSNRPDLSGPVLYASEHGAQDFELLDRYPRRNPNRFTGSVQEGKDILHPTMTVVRLSRVQGPNLKVELRERNPSPNAPLALAYVALNGHVVTAVPLSDQSRHGAEYDVQWSLAPGVLQLLGPGGQPTMTTPIAPQGALAFGMGFGRSSSLQNDELIERRVPYRAANGSVDVLLPGEQWHQLIINHAFWIRERGSRVVKQFTALAP